MTIRIAINGYGRIGRNVLRALFESKRSAEIDIIAINDLGDARTNAHLTQYDTVHGRFPYPVTHDGSDLVINGRRIHVSSIRNPEELRWKLHGIDIVMECTGLFTSKAKAAGHLAAGARKELISAPGGPDVDATVVVGVNHGARRAEHNVVSNASCTTDCLALAAKVLNDGVGIANGLMTTIHSFTNDQALIDMYHEDLRRARSATQSMIPAKTGAAAAVGLVLPELAGRLAGFAARVPTINASLVDLVSTAKRDSTVDEVNVLVQAAAGIGPLARILGYTVASLVSVDLNHDPHSSVSDATCTKVSGRLVRVCAWYDNEWGFSNRMLDTAFAMAGV